MYKTLKETWGSEVKFTQHLATSVSDLNKITKLLGLPKVKDPINEYTIPGGSIDVVAFTDKGDAIIFEHQDQSGRTDQTHVDKTINSYPEMLRQQGHRVIASILLADSTQQHHLEMFKRVRTEFKRRPKKWSYKNVHIVKSQWTATNEYEPTLFEDTDYVEFKDKPITYYKEFVEIYAADWQIVREDISTGAKTLWHKIYGLSNNYEAYIHTLSNSVKVGLHCKKFTSDDETFMQTILPEGWIYRNAAKDKRTIEIEFPLTVDYDTLWEQTEKLKRNIRKRS